MANDFGCITPLTMGILSLKDLEAVLGQEQHLWCNDQSISPSIVSNISSFTSKVLDVGSLFFYFWNESCVRKFLTALFFFFCKNQIYENGFVATAFPLGMLPVTSFWGGMLMMTRLLSEKIHDGFRLIFKELISLEHGFSLTCFLTSHQQMRCQLGKTPVCEESNKERRQNPIPSICKNVPAQGYLTKRMYLASET